MSVSYDPWKVAVAGFTPTYDAFCVATDGYQCPGPRVVSTSAPTQHEVDRRKREERDRRDLLDLLHLIVKSYG